LNASSKSKSFESYNFGISGHATVDESLILRNIASRYKLDIIVVQIGSNDFIRDFNHFEDYLNIDTASGMAPAVKERLRHGKAIPAEENFAPKSLKSWLAEHSALYLTVAERFNYSRLRKGSDIFLSDQLRKKGLMISEPYWETDTLRTPRYGKNQP